MQSRSAWLSMRTWAGRISDRTSVTVAACVAGLLMAYLVFDRIFVFGSSSGHWVYRYFAVSQSIPLYIPIAVFILLGLTVFLGSRYVHTHEGMALLGSFVAAVVIQVLIQRIYPFPLGKIVSSKMANSFYTVAVDYPVGEVLSRYIALSHQFPIHAQSNMPGKILLFELFAVFTRSPQVMGYLVIVLSTLGAVLLYAICKSLFQDRDVAFYAFVLYVLIPGKLVFLPILNTVTPVLMLLCLFLFVSYLENRNAALLLLLGVALYALVLFEPSPLVTGTLFVGILISAIVGKSVRQKDIWLLVVVPLVGFAGAYAVMRVLSGFDLFAALVYVARSAADFNVQAKRGYRIWFIENQKEFFYSAGTPVMIIYLYVASTLCLELTKWKDRVMHWSTDKTVVLSLLVMYVIVALLGINRGEVTRLWIYLAVLFQIPAAVFIARSSRARVLLYLVASTLAVQSMIALQRVAFIRP